MSGDQRDSDDRPVRPERFTWSDPSEVRITRRVGDDPFDEVVPSAVRALVEVICDETAPDADRRRAARSVLRRADHPDLAGYADEARAVLRQLGEPS